MIIKLDLFKNNLYIPDGYIKDKKANKFLGHPCTFYTKFTNESSCCINIFECPKEIAMVFGEKENLINGIHKTMNDNQGLICVNEGLTKENNRYIYSIVKTVTKEEGCSYFLRMNIEYGKKIYEIQGKYIENGITGIRESSVMDFLLRNNIANQNNVFKEWSKDPYDANYTRGINMNASELEELDAYFANHPLSQLRELVKTVIECEDDKKNTKTNKKTLSEILQDSIDQYNNTYDVMNVSGTELHFQKERSLDILELVEHLINSIANKPKEFDKDFTEIHENKKIFKNANDFAKEELEKAKKQAIGASAGVAAGAGVVALAPHAAMWVATTFGTASTGTAISALSGAAATNAALAWLGGGALAAGGSGMAAGHAFLALAGPVGWGIAGASILASVILFANNKIKSNKEKEKEINSVKKNTESLKEMIASIDALSLEILELRNQLTSMYKNCISLYDLNYLEATVKQKQQLGTIVNDAKALSYLVAQTLNSKDEKAGE